MQSQPNTCGAEMTDYTKPLEDKRLEAAARILAAMYTNETGYYKDKSLFRQRQWVYCESRMGALLLAEARRVTLADEMAAMVANLSDALAEEIKSRYGYSGFVHPAMQRRYDRDMSEVVEARDLLT